MTEAPSLWQRFYYTRLRDVFRGRFDASLDWRLVVDNAELPHEVADAIRVVVRRTRLWRREKVDVAKELVTHFQDGLDAGHSPEELVKLFGDQRHAGLLIRYAKKRCRPLAWHVCRFALWALSVLVVAYLGLGLWMLTGKPSVKTDYLAVINQRALSVPEGERAWPLYREALTQILVNRRFPEWLDGPELNSSNARWPEAVRWLEENATALQLIRDAAHRINLGFAAGSSPKAFSPEDREVLYDPNDRALAASVHESNKLEDRTLIDAHLPQVQVLHSIAQLLITDARRAASEDDGATALANLLALFRLAKHMEETPFLSNILASVQIDKMAYAGVEEALRDHLNLWSVGQLRDLAHAITVVNVDWRRGFEGERATFRDILQRLYTDNGRGDGRPLFSAMGMRSMADAFTSASNHSKRWWQQDAIALCADPAARLLVASREEMAEAYDRNMERLMGRVETPLWQTNNEADSTRVFSAQDEQFGSLRYCLVGVFMPSVAYLRNSLMSWTGQRDGALVGIALELYHREHNAWPKSLEELSPRWLPTVPVDLITGKPLGYKIIDDRPIIYSVGVDGDDDGGRKPPVREDSDQPNPAPASPEFLPGLPRPEFARNGDWVIWSMVRKDGNVKD